MKKVTHMLLSSVSLKFKRSVKNFKQRKISMAKQKLCLTFVPDTPVLKSMVRLQGGGGLGLEGGSGRAMF